MTAIQAGRLGLKVLLLDGRDKIGAKILMSGGTTKGVPEAMKKLLEVIDTSRRLGRANDEPGVTTEDWRP